MAFRELHVVEVREILRRWQRGDSLRSIAAALGADRKTVRRYVEAAKRLGLSREPDGRPVDDDLVSELIAAIQPGAPPRIGEMRRRCRTHSELIEGWVREGCKVPKIARLLKRHAGVSVPERTLNRFIAEELRDAQQAGATVRVVDPPPGQIVEIDFMEVGKFRLDGVERKLHALVVIAVCSRYGFVWPCLSQTREDVIEGLEAAWEFFHGVFPVVVADNPKTITASAHPLAPKVNAELLEYAQDRGFVLDLARVRRPKDKPRVERMVSYVRSDCFSGESILTLEDARRHAERWCREIAGQRIHGTTRRQPLEHFTVEEQPLLLPQPDQPYDTPTWVDLKVGRDHAVTVAHALYSVPHTHREKRLRVRFDRQTVKFYDQGQVVKVHPRVKPGATQIDADDLPPGTAELATRDAETLQERVARFGDSVGEYARRLLEGDLPWTRMRHVYRLHGLCRRYGGERVDQACRTALELDVVDVVRIDRMLARGLDGHPPEPPPPSTSNVIPMRFGRDPSEFRARRQPQGDTDAS